MLDVDGNGKLTVDELRRAFESGSNARTDKFWKKFIKEVDKDGDSQISRDEFC
jgi:calcium-dependent protein kinase